jgi:hypothetical protein
VKGEKRVPFPAEPKRERKGEKGLSRFSASEFECGFYYLSPTVEFQSSLDLT